MKKLGLFALVLGLVVAFALPAFAFTIEGAKGEKMYIGGLFMTDIGFFTVLNRTKEITEYYKENINDRTELMFTVPNYSQLRGTVEVNQVGGLWEFGLGGNTYGGTAAETRYVELRKLYGWYNFGNCQILAGKTDGYVYSVAPLQVMGFNNGNYVAGFGWGNIYDSRSPQVRFTQNISKQFSYAISLVSTEGYTDSTRLSYSQIPAIAAKFSMDFGVVALKPAAVYQTIKWDQLPAGYDDSMASWYAVLPVIVKAGPFTGTFQAGYGQNIGTRATQGQFGLLLLESAYQSYQRDIDGKIKNTTALNGFIDLAFTAGPITPHVYFGYDKATNTNIWKSGDDNNIRTMWGISALYAVAPSFYLIPEFTMYDYDYGRKPNIAGSPDIGKSWVGGVQFRFMF